MSLRINANKTALRRTTNLPTSFAAFTMIACVKLAVARPTHNAHVLYMQNTDTSHAESLQIRGSLGTDLVATDSYESTISAAAATLTAGAASGAGWVGVALRGSAAGAGGLQVYHKPVGSGSLVSQAITNSPGASGFESLIVGDAPFAPGDFGVDAWWSDVYIAHLKVYNRALSDAEITAEMGQGAPVSTTDRISYHSFEDDDIAVAVVPNQGSGTFSYFNSAPSMSTDMPVFSVTPTLTLTDTLPTADEGAATAPGAPTLLTAVVSGARSITCTWTAASGTVLGYRVYAQREGQQAFVAAEAGSGATSATAVGLDPKVSYTLWVTAFNIAGMGSPSNTLVRTTLSVKVRVTKLETTLANVAGLRMIVWLAPTSGGDLVGAKVGEFPNLVAGPTVFDATEGANVVTVTADVSALLSPGTVATPPAVALLAAGASVRAQVSKGSANRSTRITDDVVVVEEV